ncbi:hypothetical protein PR048_004705, partial [Dryococelus australis]
MQMQQVLLKLRSVGFTINPDKVSWVRKQTKYLGFIVKGKLIMDAAKIASITDFPGPKNREKTNAFITHYKELRVPLNQLKKHVKFCWGDEQQKIFQVLKHAITHHHIRLVVYALVRPCCRPNTGIYEEEALACVFADYPEIAEFDLMIYNQAPI